MVVIERILFYLSGFGRLFQFLGVLQVLVLVDGMTFTLCVWY